MPQDTDRALADLRRAVERSMQELQEVLNRAQLLTTAREQGREYADIVTTEPGPLLVERLTTVLEELSAAGAAFRRSEARVLHESGLSQETIARLFGVTRQRVSALLRAAPGRAKD